MKVFLFSFFMLCWLLVECAGINKPVEKKELPYCEYICGKGNQWTGIICADKNKIRSTCK